MIVHLVRHGRAGDKRDWEGDDALRPLDARGEKQAAALARLLGDGPAGRLRSSPTRRCTQTLAPLGLVWGRPVEEVATLGTDAGAGQVLDLLREAGEGDVLCTHGEVMDRLLARLRFVGAEVVDGTGDLLAKGTVWELTVDGGRVSRLVHVDPLAEPTRP